MALKAPARPARRGKNLYFKKGGWWFAKQIEGKRQWVNLHTADESEAVRLRDEIENNPLLRPTGGLADDVDAFVAHKRGKRTYSRNSGETKVLILRRFAAWLPAGTTAAAVSVNQCERFAVLLRTEVEDSTAESYMMTLRSFFRWIVEVRRARVDNPVAKVEMPAFERRSRKRFIEKEEANRLIAAAPDDNLRFILYCGFHAGLRKDEISEARAYWFDLRGHSLNVLRAVGRERLREGEREWRPKYNKERAIPLTLPFEKFLRGFLKGQEALDFALEAKVKHGRWRYRYDFRRPLGKFWRDQKVAQATTHMTRHSFASNLKIAGKSIAKIAEWLGDTERVTEKNYAHLKPDDPDIHALV